jgi:hypothetical protein
MSTDTPRTDAHLADIRDRKGEWGGNSPEMTAFARTLERELAAFVSDVRILEGDLAHARAESARFLAALKAVMANGMDNEERQAAWEQAHAALSVRS